MGGEDAEMRFCEHKRLNMATLRMTWEAKVQLKDILVNSGFPEGKMPGGGVDIGSFGVPFLGKYLEGGPVSEWIMLKVQEEFLTTVLSLFGGILQECDLNFVLEILTILKYTKFRKLLWCRKPPPAFAPCVEVADDRRKQSM